MVEEFRLNAPDGAGCFPTSSIRDSTRMRDQVSMHLMVLGASRQDAEMLSEDEHECLNAPDGAGCFPTENLESMLTKNTVSMHLMVLGASRPLGVLSVVPPGETGPGSPPVRKRPLDRVAHRSLNQTLPSSRKGRHRRASRGSAPPDVDVGMRVPGCPCLSSQTMKRRCRSQDRVLGTVITGHVNCCAVQPRT